MTASSSSCGALSSRVSAPKIMVARSAGSQRRQVPIPSWLGSPAAAKESHARCIWLDSFSTARPPPEKTCTGGPSTEPDGQLQRSARAQDPAERRRLPVEQVDEGARAPGDVGGRQLEARPAED